jgi:hypothetical protein
VKGLDLIELGLSNQVKQSIQSDLIVDQSARYDILWTTLEDRRLWPPYDAQNVLMKKLANKL